MLKIIKSPTRIQAAGNPPKTIEEFIGPVTSETTALSVARMVSPPGRSESGQTPEFDEFTVVLRGQLRVETRDGVQDVLAGQDLDLCYNVARVTTMKCGKSFLTSPLGFGC